MRADEFCEKLIAATQCKTLYVKGGFGNTLNAKGKERVIRAYKYNEKRADKINAMPNDSFGFDCCGLVKGVIWGFYGDPSKVYGGATYKSNNLDDVTEAGLISLCKDVSTNLGTIQCGELLYMRGHCGVYLGNGLVAESTPAGKDGAQITDLSFQKWTKHGKLPGIIYELSVAPDIAKPTLRRGSRGTQVRILQEDLVYLGKELAIDGMFGPITEKAVREFQSETGISIDGIYGRKTWGKMLEVIK